MSRLRARLRVRRKRGIPARGPAPRAGDKIAYGHVRMVVPADLNEELWSWLQERGWRTVAFHPDRRRYREAPVSCIEDLMDVSSELRPLVLRDALARAAFPGGVPGAKDLPPPRRPRRR